MDKEKPPGFAAAGLPSHSSRHVGFAPPPGGSSLKREPPELSRMADHPTRSTGHRRAHSEILTLPDNIDADLSPVDAPSYSDEDPLSVYLDMDKLASAAARAPEQQILDAERPRYRHGHSQSMDGSGSMKNELLGSGGGGTSLAEEKKAMSAAELADLALVDPKRAKRIWANRQSAARSKERKMRYIAELERKVQTLQMEATTLSAQLTMLHRDTNGLTSENNELKLRLQSAEQQVHLEDALNDALREEVQRLKVATGQVNVSNGGPMTLGGKQKFYHHTQAMQSLMAAHQLQQLQIHPQHQQQLHPHHYQQLEQLPSDFKFKGVMASQSDNTCIPKE